MDLLAHGFFKTKERRNVRLVAIMVAFKNVFKGCKTVLTLDASPVGLEAVFEEDHQKDLERREKKTRRLLSDIERRYSQVEWNLGSVLCLRDALFISIWT
jgi:hypothetical protein